MKKKIQHTYHIRRSKYNKMKSYDYLCIKMDQILNEMIYLQFEIDHLTYFYFKDYGLLYYFYTYIHFNHGNVM